MERRESEVSASISEGTESLVRSQSSRIASKRHLVRTSQVKFPGWEARLSWNSQPSNTVTTMKGRGQARSRETDRVSVIASVRILGQKPVKSIDT